MNQIEKGKGIATNIQPSKREISCSDLAYRPYYPRTSQWENTEIETSIGLAVTSAIDASSFLFRVGKEG
jgi:hypothetical protein